MVKQGAGAVIEEQCGARSGPITIRMIAYRGRPLELSGENVSGEGAARCDVDGSERQLLLRA